MNYTQLTKKSIKTLSSSLSKDYKSGDFVMEDEDKAILSHWFHNKNTPYEKAFKNNAKKILLKILLGTNTESLSRYQSISETDLEQLYFSDLREVPFPAPSKEKFTFIDLFAGIGGFRIALQNCGGKCVFSSEWNETAKQTYFSNYGDMPFGDITNQKIKDMIPRKFDILCAGFPCQPFSISGKMRGFEDVRGTLFFDVCKIIEKHHPKVVFLENVKHLVHHDKGRTLACILHNLKLLGYLPSWKVLNASDFGVAQNRERIIIIATAQKEFDFDGVPKRGRIVLKDILDTKGPYEFLEPKEYTLIDAPKRQASGLIFAGYRNKEIRKAGVRPGTINLSRVHKQPNRIYSVMGVHPTLPSQESSGRFFILTEEHLVRKLTIHECYKLMGFPSRFILASSMSDQYKQIGNSVCVPMIQEIAKEILNQFFQLRA